MEKDSGNSPKKAIRLNRDNQQFEENLSVFYDVDR